jgi:hypothetical protein
MSQNGHVITTGTTGKFLTTCNLCRRPVAESPALEIPIIGQPGKKVQELMRVLLKHLTKHHAEEFQKGSALLAEFTPFLILSAFTYEDPTITPRIENIRAAIFATVRKNSITDASIEHIVAGFGLDPEDAARVNDAMRAIRDACCEFGQFAPKVPPAPQPLVTP